MANYITFTSKEWFTCQLECIVNSSSLLLCEEKHKGGGGCQLNNVRKIWTFPPVCMGRRSCKIADRKGAQDAKKSKLFSRIGKEVVSAIKKGGPNPESNTILAAVIDKTKELDIFWSTILRGLLRRDKRPSLKKFMRCMVLAELV